MVTVSVLINVYNLEKYIGECLSSVLNQTYNDFEIVVVNDGSTDDTKKIIEEYMKKDTRIKLTNLKKNLGRAKAINKGLEKCKGKYIAKLDSDDRFHKNKLEIQVNYMEENEDCYLLACGVNQLNEKNELIVKNIPLDSEEKIKEKLSEKNTIVHSSIMFRNEGIMYRNKFTYAQDYDLYLQILSKGKRIKSIPDILVDYRLQSKSISLNKMAYQKLFAEKARELYHEKLEKGSESYDEFDPNEILQIDIENSNEKIILQTNIKGNFIKYDYKKVRKYCKKYFKNYGRFNKFSLYYIVTFLPKKLVRFVIKVIPLSFLRYMNK